MAGTLTHSFLLTWPSWLPCVFFQEDQRVQLISVTKSYQVFGPQIFHWSSGKFATLDYLVRREKTFRSCNHRSIVSILLQWCLVFKATLSQSWKGLGIYIEVNFLKMYAYCQNSILLCFKIKFFNMHSVAWINNMLFWLWTF